MTIATPQALYKASIIHERDNPTPVGELPKVLSVLTRAIEADNDLERKENLVKLRAMYGRLSTHPKNREAIIEEYLGVRQ